MRARVSSSPFYCNSSSAIAFALEISYALNCDNDDRSEEKPKSENTVNIPEVGVTPQVCTTTGSCLTSTILGTFGMRYFHKLRNKLYFPIVNVDKLWSLVPQDVATGDKVPVIDVGYFKVLGKGTVPAHPFVVKAKLISKTAEKKIKEAGGAVLLTA